MSSVDLAVIGNCMFGALVDRRPARAFARVCARERACERVCVARLGLHSMHNNAEKCMTSEVFRLFFTLCLSCIVRVFWSGSFAKGCFTCFLCVFECCLCGFGCVLYVFDCFVACVE